MEYAALVEVYERLDATDSTLSKRDELARAFGDADADHLPLLVTLVRGRVFPAWDGTDLGVSSSLTTEAIATATGRTEAEIEERWRESGDLGTAAAWACEHEAQRSLFSAELSVQEVSDTLREVATYNGDGSQRRRIDAIAGLLSNAGPEEAKYVTRTALSHLRIGIGEGLVRDAIAASFLVDPTSENERTDGEFDAATAAVERAFQVTNDYPLVARTAKANGKAGLDALDIEPFRPVEVMLAEKASTLETGIDDVAGKRGDVLLEYKYDGARIQIHKNGETVRIFTRRLEEVTAAFPDIRRAVRESIDATTCVLDGEAVGYDPETGRPVAFQRFSKRIKRKHNVEELAEEIPAVVFCFDLLALGGESLLDTPLSDRLGALDRVLDANETGPDPTATANGSGQSTTVRRADNQRYTGTDAAEAFYREALAAGHEGVMLKNRTAAYQPGRRVGVMMKVKPTMETLDLVVTRAQYSEGRRSEFLGRLFLACVDDRDPEGTIENGSNEAPSEEFSEVGRLATGYTDEELRALTDRLEGLLGVRNGRVFRVEPEVVLEIEYEEIQTSPTYDSGYALRFPRFLGVREDLGPEDADSFSRVDALYGDQ